MDVVDRGFSEDCADFLDRLLKRPWIERLTAPEAWNHPWLHQYRTKVAKIPRALAVESTLNYVGHSFARSKLFQLTAYLISRFLLPREQRNNLTRLYLYYDKLRLGQVSLTDLARVQQAGNIRIEGSDQQKILPKLGIKSPYAQWNQNFTLVGIPCLEFMMFLTRDLDILKYKIVKRAFDLLDVDRNGMVTESDLEQALNPLRVSPTLVDDIFNEVSRTLRVNVHMTGISLIQFRNALLHECTRKRRLLTEFMDRNRSMRLIKECRELIRMNRRAD